MKALIYEGPKVLTVQERPEPSPAAGQVKLKIRACGICGSDTAGYLGKTGIRNPGLLPVRRSGVRTAQGILRGLPGL